MVRMITMLNMLRFDCNHFFRMSTSGKIALFHSALALFSVYELRKLSPQVTLMDLFMYMYGGLSVQGTTTIWVVVRWVLIGLFLSYLIGQILMQDFQANRLYILVRSRSKSLYFMSKFILLLLFSLFYLIVGTIAAYTIGVFFLQPSYDFSTDFMTLFQIKRADFHLLTLFFLQYLVLVNISIIQVFLCFVVDKLIYSAAIIAALMFVDIKLLQEPSRVTDAIFLNRGMALQHVINEPYDMNVSLLVLIATAVFLSVLSLYLFYRKDII